MSILNKYLWLCVPNEGNPFPLFWCDEKPNTEDPNDFNLNYRDLVLYWLSDCSFYSMFKPIPCKIISYSNLDYLAEYSKNK